MNSNYFEPSVSVVIPSYKNRGGLINSIESVLSQDYKNIVEIIVVDDNNPDSEYRIATEKLMERYNSNKIIKYICHEHNKNGAAARNTGIKASCGDLIAFLDDDDIFLDGKITKQVKYLNANKDKDAVYCHARSDGFQLPTCVIEGDGSREILLLTSNFYTPSLMFRKEALVDINGFDESFRRHQDYELLLRFFASGHKIGCVPEVLIEIGGNDGSNSLCGEKLNQLKTYFFDKFENYILFEDEKTPGFRNQVYAKHYAIVFLKHIQYHYWKMAVSVFFRFFFKSPIYFTRECINRLKAHI